MAALTMAWELRTGVTTAEKKVRRRPVNLMVRENLVAAAKELGINA